jgi:hypothetical protein
MAAVPGKPDLPSAPATEDDWGADRPADRDGEAHGGSDDFCVQDEPPIIITLVFVALASWCSP